MKFESDCRVQKNIRNSEIFFGIDRKTVKLQRFISKTYLFKEFNEKLYFKSSEKVEYMCRRHLQKKLNSAQWSLKTPVSS